MQLFLYTVYQNDNSSGRSVISLLA